MTVKLICTLGPASDTTEVIHKLVDIGVDIFRVNLSHAGIEDIGRIQNLCPLLDVNLGIDTRGCDDEWNFSSQGTIPPEFGFTEKDIKGIKEAARLRVNHVFISFCRSEKMINVVRSLHPKATIISKIEDRIGIRNLKEICDNSDAILIDRGDLSKDINLIDIPFAQRGIIDFANRHDTPCYIATNLLETLIKDDLPSRAELNDIVSCIEQGAAGLVMAGETAIGKNPVLCAEIVRDLVCKHELYKSSILLYDI